jgi:hypothetical protein
MLLFLTDMKEKLVFYRLDELTQQVDVSILKKSKTNWLRKKQLLERFKVNFPAVLNLQELTFFRLIIG